jgi:hypothetical protein
MMSEEPDSRPALAQAPFPAPVSTTTSPGWRNPWLLVVVLALGLTGAVGGNPNQAGRHAAGACSPFGRERLGGASKAVPWQGMRRINWPLSWADSVRSRRELPSRGASRQCLRIFTRIWRATGTSRRWPRSSRGFCWPRSSCSWLDVQAAVLALQAADARLASSSRPQFISLRKSLVRDLDRLRALPMVDMSGINLRL